MAQGRVNLEIKEEKSDKIKGNSGLLAAIQAANFSAFQGALNAGADINAQDPTGKNAYILAVIAYRNFKNNPQRLRDVRSILKTLKRNNVNPNVRDNKGNTAMHFAIDQKDGYCEGFLNLVHASYLLTNNQGDSPVDKFMQVTALQQNTFFRQQAEEAGVSIESLRI